MILQYSPWNKVFSNLCIKISFKSTKNWCPCMNYIYETTVLCFHWLEVCVLQLQMKHTWYYIAVGLLMIGSFLVSRVLVFPFLYWRYAVYAGLPLAQVPVHIPLKCNLGCLLILVPQLYWLFLMVRGASKVFYKIYLKSKQHWPMN